MKPAYYSAYNGGPYGQQAVSRTLYLRIWQAKWGLQSQRNRQNYSAIILAFLPPVGFAASSEKLTPSEFPNSARLTILERRKKRVEKKKRKERNVLTTMGRKLRTLRRCPVTKEMRKKGRSWRKSGKIELGSQLPLPFISFHFGFYACAIGSQAWSLVKQSPEVDGTVQIGVLINSFSGLPCTE